MKLTKGVEHPRTSVAERLEKRYGIKPAKENLQNLTVNRGERVSLNYRNLSRSGSCPGATPKVGRQYLKRWVGSPSGVFPGDHPRFGALSPIKDYGGGRATFVPDQQVGLNAIANEYLYGNATSGSRKGSRCSQQPLYPGHGFCSDLLLHGRRNFGWSDPRGRQWIKRICL